MLKLFIHTCWILLFAGGPLVSQELKERDVVLGLSLTGSGYYGDMNYSSEGWLRSDYVSFYPGFNFHVHKARYQRLLPTLNVGYGKLVAQNPRLAPVTIWDGDPPTPLVIAPNRYAETSFIYGDFGYRIQLVRRFSLISPYLGLGLGALAYFPRAADGTLLSSRRLTRAPQEASYGTLAVSSPVTLGMDVHLSRRLSLNLAYVYRLNSTDYLDNIDALGQQAGNDKLHVLRFGASFRFKRAPTQAPGQPEASTQTDSLLAALPQVAEDGGEQAPADPEGYLADPPRLVENGGIPADCDSLLAACAARVAAGDTENQKLRNEMTELNLLLIHTAKERDQHHLRSDSLLRVKESPQAEHRLAAMEQQVMRLRLQIEDAGRKQQVSEQEQAIALRERQRLTTSRDSALRAVKDLDQGQAQLAALLKEQQEEAAARQRKEERGQRLWATKEVAYQRETDSLLRVIDGLRREQDGPVDPQLQEKLEKMSRREQDIEDRERRLVAAEKQLVQREVTLTAAQADLAKKSERYEGLEAKEKSLLQLEQQLKQYAASLQPSGQSGREVKITAFAVPCEREKKGVQQRIIDYFSRSGYTYLLEKGKLVYTGVVVPEISKTPIHVSLYLIRDEKDERQLLGAFRLPNGDYLSEARYPEESRRAKRFMQQFVE